MKNHKGKPVYTFDGCLAIMKSLDTYSLRYEFADLHRDLFSDSEKLAKVLGLLGSNDSTHFLKSQIEYWDKEFGSSEEIEAYVTPPTPKKAKPSSATIFGQPVKQSFEYSDDRHHSRRNGHQ